VLARPWVRKLLHIYSPGVATIFVFILVVVGQAAAGFLVCMHSAYEHSSNGGQNDCKFTNSSRILTKTTV